MVHPNDPGWVRYRLLRIWVARRFATEGVILAGGLGTRLRPLTDVTNKHLLPVYDQPMVFYPIQTLVRAGIRDLLIVIGGPHAGHFVSVLRNGRQWGVQHLEFAYQEQEGGIAQALALAEDFADGGSVAVILGDNTTDADIAPAVSRFDGGATIFLKRVPDPQRFGVPTFDPHDASRARGTGNHRHQHPLSRLGPTALAGA